MKQKKYFFIASLILFAMTLIIYTSCKKSSDSAATTPTCSDGIQNQGETGVDCGGPCTACPTSPCTGNGTTSYYPMVLHDYWVYHETGFPDHSDTVVGTHIFGAYTYNDFEFPDPFGGSSNHKYFRAASNGDVYEYNTSTSQENLYIPGNPVVNQKWAIGTDTVKVMSLNATVTTSVCTYTGLLQLNEYFASGTLWYSKYYKKGVGWVYEADPPWGSNSLFALKLY